MFCRYERLFQYWEVVLIDRALRFWCLSVVKLFILQPLQLLLVWYTYFHPFTFSLSWGIFLSWVGGGQPAVVNGSEIWGSGCPLPTSPSVFGRISASLSRDIWCHKFLSLGFFGRHHVVSQYSPQPVLESCAWPLGYLLSNLRASFLWLFPVLFVLIGLCLKNRSFAVVSVGLWEGAKVIFACNSWPFPGNAVSSVLQEWWALEKGRCSRDGPGSTPCSVGGGARDLLTESKLEVTWGDLAWFLVPGLGFWRQVDFLLALLEAAPALP